MESRFLISKFDCLTSWFQDIKMDLTLYLWVFVQIHPDFDKEYSSWSGTSSDLGLTRLF